MAATIRCACSGDLLTHTSIPLVERGYPWNPTANPPMMRYSTRWKFSNLKNSLKSGGSSITIIHRPECHHVLKPEFSGLSMPPLSQFRILKVIGDGNGSSIQTQSVCWIDGVVGHEFVTHRLGRKRRVTRFSGCFIVGGDRFSMCRPIARKSPQALKKPVFFQLRDQAVCSRKQFAEFCGRQRCELGPKVRTKSFAKIAQQSNSFGVFHHGFHRYKF